MLRKDREMIDPGRPQRDQAEERAEALGHPDLALNENPPTEDRDGVAQRMPLMLGAVRVAREIGLVPTPNELIEVGLGEAPDDDIRDLARSARRLKRRSGHRRSSCASCARGETQCPRLRTKRESGEATTGRRLPAR